MRVTYDHLTILSISGESMTQGWIKMSSSEESKPPRSGYNLLLYFQHSSLESPQALAKDTGLHTFRGGGR